jgi:uncharacterized protein (TIGR00251 family)
VIDYKEEQGKLSFAVQAVPRSSRSQIVGEHDGALRVKITAPPLDGAANEALVRLLAKAFDLPTADVEIVSGRSSKRKHVSISGGTAAKLKSLAANLKR